MAYVAMAFIAMEQLRAGVGVWCPFFSRANGAHSHSLYSYGLFRVNRLHCVDEAIERPQKRRVLLELSVPTRTVDAASRSVKGDSRGSESEMVAPLGAKEERFGEVTFFFLQVLHTECLQSYGTIQKELRHVWSAQGSYSRTNMP